MLTTTRISIETSSGERFVFKVELARTPEEISKGLMFRESLPEDGGMLFIFPDIAPRAFWMVNTLVELDMLFINADGTIRHIHHRAQPRDPADIHSQGPARAVLEILGGRARELGIAPGDMVRHPLFMNMNK